MIIRTIAAVVNQHLEREYNLYFALMDSVPTTIIYDYHLQRHPGHRREVRRPEWYYRFTIEFQDTQLILKSNIKGQHNTSQLSDLLTVEYASPNFIEQLDSQVRTRLNQPTAAEQMVQLLHQQIYNLKRDTK